MLRLKTSLVGTGAFSYHSDSEWDRLLNTERLEFAIA